jgi:glycosyltransferase involved in cell wall biosynthesis
MHDVLTETELKKLRYKVDTLKRKPLISVVMPVYNTPAQFLSRAIESVRDQVYPNWELCVADDASTALYIKPLLEQFAKLDSRIKAVFRPKNGHISAASNSAIEVASGEYTAFLDHDDELAPHALYYVAKTITENPAVEIIYSDEDKIDESGQRFTPHFKTDWNPDLLTSQNYFCHLTAYKTATLRTIGGLRVGYEGSQDWDLALRVAEGLRPEQIQHIPRVLYHWRAIEGSTAIALSAKNYTSQAARRALEEHFVRIKQPVKLSMVIGDHWRVHYPIHKPVPLVTLIIPTRNRLELLATCIESIQAKTRYPNFEFLIADNESDDPAVHAYYQKQKVGGRFTMVSCPGPFNFSAINNLAAKQAKGEIIGFLNNDLEAMNVGWLDEMVSHAIRSEIGVVGAKLYYPDMTLQHAGVITGLGGVAGHAFKHLSRSEPGTPQFRPHLVHNVSAVTAACLVLRKGVFNEVGGFDEVNLKIAFNDVDFCLRVQSLGYRNLFTPFAEFIHHESASRGAEDSAEKISRFQAEITYMKKRWGSILLNDPAYNPNFSLDTEDFAFAHPPRIPSLYN